MKAIYLRTHSLSTPVIRARFWSDWSHCGIITPELRVIEARLFGGVIESSLTDVIARSSKHEIIDIPCPDDAAGLAWARTQLGKPYDLMGALGLGLNRKWENDDSWFCSEVLEMTVIKAGRRRFRSEAWRIDPQASYNVI